MHCSLPSIVSTVALLSLQSVPSCRPTNMLRENEIRSLEVLHEPVDDAGCRRLVCNLDVELVRGFRKVIHWAAGSELH